jgi:hypothetical protein
LLQRRDGFVSVVRFEEPAPGALVDVMPGFAPGAVTGKIRAIENPCVARLFTYRPTEGRIQLD